MPALTSQRTVKKLQCLEFVAVTVITGQTEHTPGLEPEAGIVGRVAQDNDESKT